MDLTWIESGIINIKWIWSKLFTRAMLQSDDLLTRSPASFWFFIQYYDFGLGYYARLPILYRHNYWVLDCYGSLSIGNLTYCLGLIHLLRRLTKVRDSLSSNQIRPACMQFLSCFKLSPCHADWPIGAWTCME